MKVLYHIAITISFHVYRITVSIQINTKWHINTKQHIIASSNFTFIRLILNNIEGFCKQEPLVSSDDFLGRLPNTGMFYYLI